MERRVEEIDAAQEARLSSIAGGYYTSDAVISFTEVVRCNRQVTFEAIARPHWELTKQAAKGRCLVIGDTTEFDFGKDRKIAGIGPTGNGSGQGFLWHNALLVHAASEEIIGVAGQTIHYRKKKPKSRKRENSAQIKKRPRESEVWGTVIDQIGKPRCQS